MSMECSQQIDLDIFLWTACYDDLHAFLSPGNICYSRYEGPPPRWVPLPENWPFETLEQRYFHKGNWHRSKKSSPHQTIFVPNTDHMCSYTVAFKGFRPPGTL